MADCSCDFCTHDEYCPYAYDESDCYVRTIKNAKSIVDDEFKAFFTKLEERNEELYDDNVNALIFAMRNILHDSNQPLPDWVAQDVRDDDYGFKQT